ncbi:aminotransferase class V-fold PLP-dependent enzyme, partial [bacterium]|nr:aminotransferase class V-fold PLP-dependent enzyme [bacterium]
QEKICVRAGHHCAAVLHQHLGISASVRVSLAIYNSAREIDRLAEVLSGVRKKLGHE